MITAVSGFSPSFFGTNPKSAYIPPRIKPDLTRDIVQFGQRVSENLPVKPELNLHTRQNPFKATVVSVKTLKPEEGNIPPEQADVIKVVLDMAGSNLVTPDGKRARIAPGQSLLVVPNIPKGLRYLEPLQKLSHDKTLTVPLKDERHRPYLMLRRYSIADVHEGSDGVKITLVIKRVEYEGQDGKKEKGLISNQLANIKPGKTINILGPDTNRFLMPAQRDANLLLFSTGIAAMAPLGDFLQTRFDGQKGELGETRLYAGYKHREDEMCRTAYNAYASNTDNRFKYTTAFSRDSEKPEHINDLIRKDAKNILELLDKDNTYVYLCGVKDVETSVISTLLQVAADEGRTVDQVLDLIQALKKSGHWRVEGVRQPFRHA